MSSPCLTYSPFSSEFYGTLLECSYFGCFGWVVLSPGGCWPLKLFFLLNLNLHFLWMNLVLRFKLWKAALELITSFLVKCILEVDHAKEVPVICCRKCVGIQHRYLCICAFKTLNSLYINQEDKLLTVPFCQLKCVFQIGISELVKLCGFTRVFWAGSCVLLRFGSVYSHVIILMPFLCPAKQQKSYLKELWAASPLAV